MARVLSSKDQQEMRRLQTMFGQTDWMKPCSVCRFWSVEGTLYRCPRFDHAWRTCNTCQRQVCAEWNGTRNPRSYLFFLEDLAEAAKFDKCILCQRCWGPDDTFKCDGHDGRICRECMPEFGVIQCGSCERQFCSLCVADDMWACPGTRRTGECHHQVCRECHEERDVCRVCFQSAKRK